MNRFIDGPAHGVTLTFHRTPVFVRAVLDSAGKWDVLNELEDTAAPDETLHVYRMEGTPMRGFWDGTSKGRRTGGPLTMATYRYLSPQPDDATMRDNDQWSRWVHSQPEAKAAK